MGSVTEDRIVGGRYRLRSELGRGGMGTVWAARDEVLGRDVAVKEIVAPPSLSPEERRMLRERTLREARAAAQVSCPTAVTVYDVVEEADRPWVVMELLPTRSLADLLREEGTLTPRRAAEVGLDVLEALTAAHEAGVLHRDVKPSNVMVDDGRAVLADFGIATLEGDPALTSTGMLVGSPSYMAPERARGQGPLPASDLWSLGATLFTAVQGRAPFERGSQLATLAAVVGEETPPAPAAGPLEPVLHALLAKDPGDRPEPDRLREMLEAVLRSPEADRPLGDRPMPAPVSDSTTPIPVVVQPDRRRVRPVLALLLATLVLAAGALAVTDALRDGQGQEPGVSPGPADPGGEGESADEAAPEDGAAPSPPDDGAAPSPPDDGAPAEAEPQEQGQQAPAESLPDGYVLHEDPTGFRIGVPEGWERSTEGPRTYFRDPESSRYLMVDQTTEPADDALVDWQANEQGVSQRLADYQRVSMERVEYRDYDAVDWEFTFAGDGDRVHVVNRNVRVDDGQAYAIYWSTSESRWADSFGVFETAVESFQPSGS
ncbi:MAG TPA: protein kinase [Jiangellales bacterium]|nr:protein kinase [Jiangellales bacterium]